MQVRVFISAPLPPSRLELIACDALPTEPNPGPPCRNHIALRIFVGFFAARRFTNRLMVLALVHTPSWHIGTTTSAHSKIGGALAFAGAEDS